jgi:GNAT superfamily N-acetyltransferase
VSDALVPSAPVASEIDFRSASVDGGPGGELAQAMREEIATLYDGLELDGPSMPRAGAEELSAPGGAFIVGWRDGEAICCGGLKRLSEDTCEIKKMYVVPAARGQGTARILLHALERTALELGYAIARLDTGPKQVRAQYLYEDEGYQAIADFNDNPVAVFWGEKRLRG